MPAEPARFVLTLSCGDRRGIVAAVANCIASQDCNIVESAQYGDPETERFFMRVSFSAPPAVTAEKFTRGFLPVATGFDFDWRLHDLSVKPRVLILVSKLGHCLNDLLYRNSIGHLPMELVAVVSNHEDMRRRVEAEGIDYIHLPIGRGRARRAGGADRRAGRRRRGSTSSCSPATCRSCRTGSPTTLAGPGDQHPPLVPAELRRGAALSQGA